VVLDVSVLMLSPAYAHVSLGLIVIFVDIEEVIDKINSGIYPNMRGGRPKRRGGRRQKSENGLAIRDFAENHPCPCPKGQCR
jgi:hypothetical protein